ncbi:hypothetical protein [Streptomyces sp. BBFR102]|uniref:hypothetical protein n=1 Tax=Streptomyces sp. BBFR102 TaxID=3448171 RepID=UPI003F52DFBE
MAIMRKFSTRATDEKGGLTLGELRKLLEAAGDDAPDDAQVRVRTGWKSQVTQIEIG